MGHIRESLGPSSTQNYIEASVDVEQEQVHEVAEVNDNKCEVLQEVQMESLMQLDELFDQD